MERLYKYNKSDKILIEILKILYYLNDESALPFLLQLFNTKKITNQKILQLLIKTLGVCGNLDTVDFLYNNEKNCYNPIVKKQYNDAILHIHSRIKKDKNELVLLNKQSSLNGNISLFENTEKTATIE